MNTQGIYREKAKTFWKIREKQGWAVKLKRFCVKA
jgi:hypothetical protein